MRNFRVRLSASVQVERFVTVMVPNDAHNPDMVAMVMADQEGRKNGEVWTVLTSTRDRLGDLETVRVPDVRELRSPVSVTDPTELLDGCEVLRVTVSGSERVAFFPRDPEDDMAAMKAAEDDCNARRRTASPRVAYLVQDTFGEF